MKRHLVLAWVLVGTLCVGCSERPAQTTANGKAAGSGEDKPGTSVQGPGAAAGTSKSLPESAKLDAKRIERLLPEGTIALVTLDDISRMKSEFPKTALGAIWREEEVQAFVAKPMGQLAKVMRQVEAIGGFSFADIKKAFGGQVALALVRLDPPARRRDAPSVVAVCAARITDAAAAGRLFDRLMALVKMGPVGPAARDITMPGWRGVSIPLGRTVEVTVALGDDFVLFTVAPPEGGDAERFMAACDKPPEKSLATSAEFRHTMGRLGTDRLATVYISGDHLRDSIFAALRVASAKDAALAENVVRTLGLDRVHGLGVSVAIDAPGIMQRSYYHAPKPRKGLVALVSGSEVSHSTLALAPEDVLSYTAASIKLSEIIGLARAVAETVGESRQFERGLDEARRNLGFDIEKDLLENLGDDVAVIIFPGEVSGANPLMMGAGGISLVLSLEDADAVSDVVDRILMMADDLLQRSGSGSMAEIEFLGTRIRYARIMGGMISPSVALTRDRLFITGGLSAAKELVRLSLENPAPFIETDAARAAFAKVGGVKGVAVSYADPTPAVLMGTAYTGMIAGMTLPALGSARERARRTKCISNLKMIALGCALWSGDNNERFPESLDVLFGDYISDREVFSCPSNPARRSYCYVSGLRAADPSDWILAYEPFENHDGKVANVVCISGQYMQITDATEIERKVARQIAMLKQRGRVAKVIEADTTGAAMAGRPGAGGPGGGIDVGEFSDWVDLALMPSPRAYTRHLFPQVTRTIADDDGILSTSYGPVGAVGIPSMGGVAGVAVVAAIAIPNLLSSRMVSNDSAAIAGLRAYLGAQGTFQRVDWYGNGQLVYANPKDGTGFPDLFQIGFGRPGSAPDRSAIKLIDLAMARATGPATAKAGYYFVDLTGDVVDGDYEYSYACGLCAVPALYGKTGLNTFVVDLTGTVYKKDTGGRPVTRYPDTTKEGWLPVGY